MLGLGKTGAAGAPATASPARGQVIYQRHAAALYRQALLMLDDSALGPMLLGGLGYVRASRVLMIGPHDMAVLLRTAMRKLATSSAATAWDGDPVRRPAAGGQ